jgi:hypothetical protein
MLVFVMALQSPAASKNWERVSTLCERSLRSACAQTTDAFRIILVCTEKPKINFENPNLRIIEENFSTPRDAAGRMADKWNKLRLGCVAARAHAPCHVMLMDADDLVSRRLAAFCADYPESSGWLFRRGYVHEEGSRWLLRQNDFFRICGTSSIVRCKPDELPAHPKENSDRFLILKHGHTVIEDAMRREDRPFADLPFPGAIYEVGTGENDSGFSLKSWAGKKEFFKRLPNLRPITTALRAEFGIRELP